MKAFAYLGGLTLAAVALGYTQFERALNVLLDPYHHVDIDAVLHCIEEEAAKETAA
jgi:hypothetical protein